MTRARMISDTHLQPRLSSEPQREGEPRGEKERERERRGGGGLFELTAVCNSRSAIA